MKKLLTILLISIACNMYAQENDIYLQQAFKLLKQGDIDNAKKSYGVYKDMTYKRNSDFDKALVSALIDAKRFGEAHQWLKAEKVSKESKEITRLQKLVETQIDDIHGRANRLIKHLSNDSLEQAIIEYRKLIGTDKPNIYCCIGLCNEKLKRTIPAKEEYINGVNSKEPFAPYCLASLLQKTNEAVSNDSLISLYSISAQKGYKSACDSLAVQYKKIGDINSSYKWFKESGSDFGKYQAAMYLRNKYTAGKLSDEYKNDNAIQLLKEAAKNYTPARNMLIKINQGYSNLKTVNTAPVREYKRESIIVDPDMDKIIPLSTLWDDIKETFEPDDATSGLGYSYSEYFPVSLSANYTYSYFSIGLEAGANIDGKKYGKNKYNPQAYLAISPGLYFRYLSLNCGIGFVASKYTKTTTWGDNTYTEDYKYDNEDGSISIGGSTTITTVGGSTSTVEHKPHFMLKPSITGYIPICDEDFYITLNAGYNYIPKFKEVNGLSFGVGIQWKL